MYRPDRMPETLPNKQFPIGDVVDKQKEERAKAWFRRIEALEPGAFVKLIGNTYQVQPLDSDVVRRNHEASLQLCIDWDHWQGDNRHFAVTGFYVGRSFMNETMVLPKFTTDLRTEIENMRSIDLVTRAREFAHTAWSGMRFSHPRVFAYHERLYEHAMGVYELTNEDYKTHFRAGMMVPYMLSATSRLVGYTGDFTGLKQNDYNLKTTPFRRFFTNETDLAHEDPKRRLL